MANPPAGPQLSTEDILKKRDNVKETNVAAMTTKITSKGTFSTKDIIASLASVQYELSADDTMTAAIAAGDTRLRHAEIAVTEYPSRIQDTINKFQNRLAELGALGSRSALAEESQQNSNFAPHKAAAQQSIEQREKMAEEVEAFVRNSQDVMEDAIAAKKEGKSAADVMLMLANIRSKTADIVKQIVKLNRNEEATQSSLNFVFRRLTEIFEVESKKLGLPITQEQRLKPE